MNMPSLKTTMLSNLREMAKLRAAAHDSMFKFSIKKMFPFSLIFPQVNWNRIVRMMDSLQEKCKEQKIFLANEKKNASEEELPFLNLLPQYLDALAQTAGALGKAAAFRQNALEKKIKLNIKEWNEILKKYNAESDTLAKIGIVLYKAY